MVKAADAAKEAHPAKTKAEVIPFYSHDVFNMKALSREDTSSKKGVASH